MNCAVLACYAITGGVDRFRNFQLGRKSSSPVMSRASLDSAGLQITPPPMSTLTVTEAKAKFGRLADRALRTGKPVLVRRKGRLVQIAAHVPFEPIPHFPVGSLKVTQRQLDLDKLAGPDVGPDDL